MSRQPWDLPSSRTPVPVGWRDQESTELDRLARRLRDERTKQTGLGMPQGKARGKRRPLAQPKPTNSGRWSIVVRHDGWSAKRTFDTAEEAAAWRDQMMKERKNG